MKINACGDYVFAKKIAAPTKMASGLYVPGTAEALFTQAQVIAVGPGFKTEKGVIEPAVKEGDIIMVSSQSVSIKIEDQDLIVMHENEVLCVLS
jgi:chaperonin GroES